MWNYRFTMQVPFEAPDDELLFVRQLGVDTVYTWLPPDRHDLASLLAFKQRLEGHGMTLYNVLSGSVAKHPAIHLNLPGRDEAIARFTAFLHMLADAGLGMTTFTWEPDQVWSTGNDALTREARARYVVSSDLKARPMTHGRVYTQHELWDNFAYFMRKVLPVAEDRGVRLALHPNDPPVRFPIAGVPPLIRSFADYRKAFVLAGSRALGMEFCTGCWLEGGGEFGDVVEGLRWCLENDRVLVVHFRNVSSPLPDFTETFLDNGYFDMYSIMDALCAADYRGAITLDHTPVMVDGPALYAPRAYAIGYMRALAERAAAARS